MSTINRVVWTLGLLSSASCGSDAERSARADPAPSAPHVTVASPVLTPVSEVSEYTGRAEAVDSVEIRARASGYLTRVTFHEGDLVKKGDLLFVVDPRPATAALAQARAELARLHVDHGLATRDTARAAKLRREDVIPEQQWDTQNSQLDQIVAREASATAALEIAQLDLDYCYVRAPVDGRIGRIVVTVGNLVGPTLPSPLASLVSVDPLYVYVDVDESRALRLGRSVIDGKRGATVAFGDETGHPHPANIDFLDNRIDPQTGTQKARVVVKNEGGALTPGLFARVNLPETDARLAILVADRAIGTDQDRRFVFVVDADNKVQYRAVKLGPTHDGLRIVREGVKDNDRVIVAGLQRVRAGAVVVAENGTMSEPESVQK